MRFTARPLRRSPVAAAAAGFGRGAGRLARRAGRPRATAAGADAARAGRRRSDAGRLPGSVRRALHRRLPAPARAGPGLRAGLLSLSEHRDLRRACHARHRRLAQDPRHHPQRVVPPRAGPAAVLHRRRRRPRRCSTSAGPRRRATAPESCACRRWPSGCGPDGRDSRAVSLAVKPRSAVMMAGKGATAVTWVGVDGWQTSTAFARAAGARSGRARSGPLPYERERGIVWEPAARRGDLRGHRRRHRRAAANRLDQPVPPSTAQSRSARGVHRALADQPLCRRAARRRRRSAGRELSARASWRRRLPRRQLPRHRQGRARLRTRQLRAAGHRGPARPHPRRAADALDRLVGRDRYVLGALGRSRRGPGARGAAGPRRERRTGRAGDGGRHGEQPPSPPRASGRDRTWRASSTRRSTSPRRRGPRSPPRPSRRRWPRFARCPACAPPCGRRRWRRSTRSDPVLRAMQAGFVPDRSGDITLAPAPYWIFVPGRNPNGGNATTHGSSNEYDQHVPLVFLGAPFAPWTRPRRRHPRRRSRRRWPPPSGSTYDGVEGRALAAAVRK